MADEPQYSSSRSDNKRKFDDPSPPPPPSYNSVAPPLDGIQLAKLKAQEIAAKLFSESEAKRPKNDNGAAADDNNWKTDDANPLPPLSYNTVATPLDGIQFPNLKPSPSAKSSLVSADGLGLLSRS